MSSAALYNYSTMGYVLGLAVFAVHVVKSKDFFLRAGLLLVAFGFLLQTGGMVARWIEAGQLEVLAMEKALGTTLSGISWFVVFTQHPPWSNLYEIMVYMSWGLILVTLVVELKWQISWIRQAGLILALMALGVASLTDASIKPLVPALKSWWIMIHVISASVAYAAGSIAAVICLVALIKDDIRVPRSRLFGWSLVFLGILLFCLGGGPRLIMHGEFLVKLMAFAGASMVNALDMAKDNGKSILVAMPWAGPWYIATTALHLVFGISLLLKRPENVSKRALSFTFGLSLIASFSLLALVVFHGVNNTVISPDQLLAHHIAPSGPYFLSLRSCAWSLTLLALVVIAELLLFMVLRNPGSANKLPEVAALEETATKCISLSFFLMSIVLVTGALWAHYAWGRYWAWDPKETGALLIWINYAIYLHTRRTNGLSGPVTSLIGVMGFFVIILGFLGVNLGLFADGLHTYGNG